MASPVRLDPFQNIVNVGWGSKGEWAVVQTRQIWTGANTIPTVQFALPQLGFPPLPIENIAILDGIYEHDTIESSGGVTITTTTYDYEVTFSHPPDSGFATGVITVVSDGTTSNWFTDGGEGGSGGIAEAEAYMLSHGWDTFSATETGSSSETSSGVSWHTGERNVVWLFNVKLLALAITTDPLLAIGVALGSPDGVEGGPTLEYDWNVYVDTYRNATKDSFPVDGTAFPQPGWPANVAHRNDSGSVATTFFYSVAFADLAIGIYPTGP